MSIPASISPLGLPTEKNYPIGTAIFTVWGEDGNKIDYPVNLNEITNGNYLLAGYGDTITEIPYGVTFENIVSADNMFSDTSISVMPESVTFRNLKTVYWFWPTRVRKIPDACTFSNVENGESMFRNCIITDCGDKLNFGKMTSGANFAAGGSICEKLAFSVLNTITPGAHTLHLGSCQPWKDSTRIKELLGVDSSQEITAGTYSVKNWTVYINA